MCEIDLFRKCTCIVPLKDKRGITIADAFQKIISKGRKPNKIWVDQVGQFYNKLFKRFVKINSIEIYSTYDERKSAVAERFIRTLQNKIFKRITAISKNLYFDVLDDVVNKYNNTVHRTIKMKPTDVTSDSYAEYNQDSNKKGYKFKVSDRVSISKYKNSFVKGYTQNSSEEVFVISKINYIVPWTYAISDLNGEPIGGTFYKKELQKNSQEKFRIEKVIKRKGDNCMSNGKDRIIYLIVGLIKRH